MRRVLFSLAAVLAASAPAFAELQIKDVKPMYGALGPQRKTLDVFPGDDFFFGFSVTGAAVDDKGNVDMMMTVDAFDPAGKQALSQTTPIKGVLALGGDSFPAVATVNFGTGVAPGDYKVTVTVKDKIKDGTATFDRTISVKPADFCFVKLHFSYDEQGVTPAPVGGMVNQKLFYTVKVLNFDKTTQKIKVTMKGEILDEKGKPTMPQPLTATAASENAQEVGNATDLNFNANLSLNRPGAFTLRLTFTDEIGKKTATVEVPLKVAAP